MILGMNTCATCELGLINSKMKKGLQDNDFLIGKHSIELHQRYVLQQIKNDYNLEQVKIKYISLIKKSG